MVAQLIALASVLVALIAPFAVEWFKGTRWKDEQNRVIGVNAWAEQFTPPGTPPGYCHLKYVVRNSSPNDITDVAVVPPGRDKLRFIPVVHAGAQESEVDPNLRQLDASFSNYPVELVFTDSWSLLWHQHRRLERVTAVNAMPRTIRDYVTHPRNPQGMAVARRRGLLMLAGCVVAAIVAYGVASSGLATPGPESPKNKNTESPKQSPSRQAKRAGS
ncbi:hypothetical protein [Streptomyces sp. NPDC001978]|uniref:hypothetical protein n=1 Tax=Streptomyces sp. NPDC001978 TaxID=3364627 RepID=UPI0036968489